MLPGNTIIYGETGEGKSLYAVHEIQDYLRRGRRVATNMEIDLGKLMPPRSKITYWMLPQCPKFEDLDFIGRGTDSKNPNDFGLLVLDEAPSFLDAREWNAAGRKQMVEWVRHARKRGWRLAFISQHPELIDKQVRKSAFPLVAQVRRLDHVKIPFLPLRLPRMHLAVFRYGGGQNPLIVKRRWFFGGSLQNAYDTNQEYFESETGVKEMPSAWQSIGSKMRKWDIYKGAIFGCLLAGLAVGSVISFPAGMFYKSSEISKINPDVINKPKYNASIYVTGYVLHGAYPSVMLSDGRIVYANKVKTDLTGTYFQIENVWVGMKK